MGRLPDLSAARQLAIWSATFIAIFLVLFRVTIVIRRGLDGTSYYPRTWTPQQLEHLQHIKIVVGIVLFIAWAGLLVAAPYFPLRYPFSQSRSYLLIGLLLQTYAFLVMVAPHDLNNSPIARLKFTHV